MSAFTLIDLLTSIAVIAVLIGLLLPSLSLARETTRRIVCSSNVRQIGLGLAMYQDDYGKLPPSRFVAAEDADAPPQPRSANFAADTEGREPHNVLFARLAGGSWDGLGYLFIQDYLSQFGVFYCPSHHGKYPLREQTPYWGETDSEIVINYQFRADTGDQTQTRSALLSDGLRTREDYSHKVGTNVLRRDLSVGWFSDPAGALVAQLPQTPDEAAAAEKVRQVWQELDR